MMDSEVSNKYEPLTGAINFFALSMIVSLIVSLRIKVKESAQTAALILGIIHLGWVLPDIINLVSGNQHPPIPIMILTLIPVLVLFHAWKKAEI